MTYHSHVHLPGVLRLLNHAGVQLRELLQRQVRAQLLRTLNRLEHLGARDVGVLRQQVVAGLEDTAQRLALLLERFLLRLALLLLFVRSL